MAVQSGKMYTYTYIIPSISELPLLIDLMREGEGDVAEQYVKKAMARFAKTAYDNWEKRVPHGK